MTRGYLPVAVLTFGAAVAVATAGCHKNIPQQTATPSTAPVAPPAPAPLRGSTSPGGATGSGQAQARASEQELFGRKSLEQLNEERPLGDVFFDLDRSDLRDDARALLAKNADWVKKWTSTSLTVEGHSDARGSSEYNLALASRRADAVKTYLISLGITPGRITLVSKGKEQPFCYEENEGCWQQNRRGHFLVTAK